MAFIPKNICTHDTEQDITAKKTFTKGLMAESFRLLDGSELKPTAVETLTKNQRNKIVVGGGGTALTTTDEILLKKEFIQVKRPVKAAKFIGDLEGRGTDITHLQASELEGLVPTGSLPLSSGSFEVVEGRYELAIAEGMPFRISENGIAFDWSKIGLVQPSDQRDAMLAVSPKRGLVGITVKSLASHLSAYNGKAFSFVNDGQNLGNGVCVFKGKKTSGRSQDLQFKTLVFDDNFVIEDSGNEIKISLKDIYLEEVKKEEAELRQRMHELEQEQIGAQKSTAKALQDQITLALEALDERQRDHDHEMSERKEQLQQMIKSFKQITKKNNKKS